jgi:xanthine dehydrogenase accessory factor
MTHSVLVLCAGDMGSAVAHALHGAGFAVAIADDPAPPHPRRGMAFADALWDGHAHLAGLDAVRIDTSTALAEQLALREAVAITALPMPDILSAVTWHALVDARMRKRITPPDRRGLAPLSIGLGVGFVAGTNCDLAIETSWDALGQVVRDGATLPLRGEPRAIGGVGRERAVYSPVEGVARTSLRIGDRVLAGDPVLDLHGAVLRAPIPGVLRGVVRDGVRVAVGAKVLEVDPRGQPELCFGLGERPRHVALGVLAAIGGHSRL